MIFSSFAKIIQHWLLGKVANDFSQPCENHPALAEALAKIILRA